MTHVQIILQMEQESESMKVKAEEGGVEGTRFWLRRNLNRALKSFSPSSCFSLWNLLLHETDFLFVYLVF